MSHSCWHVRVLVDATELSSGLASGSRSPSVRSSNRRPAHVEVRRDTLSRDRVHSRKINIINNDNDNNGDDNDTHKKTIDQHGNTTMLMTILIRFSIFC